MVLSDSERPAVYATASVMIGCSRKTPAAKPDSRLRSEASVPLRSRNFRTTKNVRPSATR